MAAAVFRKYGIEKLSKPIKDFEMQMLSADALSAMCEDAYNKMIEATDKRFPGKFLAVLFKNPSASKQVFEDAA